ncbi:hypothetical protein LJR130_001038 [Variovorax sp. LjRoot130]|uniref:hypothetical protein n=1 Tax=Variovorax sp. LjRoot130 TaxID=3342261 RepID=UPI003ECC285A
MTERKNVPRADIDAWMTQALQKVDDCEGSTLKVRYLLQQSDEGCNWSEGLLSVGRGITVEQAWPIAHKIVEEARLRFNVAQ